MQTRLLLTFIFVLGTSFPALATPQQKIRANIIASLVETHVRPRYNRFAQATKHLDIQTLKLCANPSKNQLTQTRKAFSLALKSWMAVQHLKFGPVMQKDRIYRIQYWPDKHGQGRKHLRKILNDESLVAPDPVKFQNTSVALQGFGAMELYLFSKASKNLLETNKRSKRLCGFVQASTKNLATMATEIKTGWSKEPSQTTNELVQEFYQMFNDQLLIIENLKLLRPLGKSIQSSRGKRSESWKSDLSLFNIADNLEGLLALYDGENGGIGLRAGMISEGETADFDKAISDQLKYVVQLSRSFQKPLHKAVSDPETRSKLVFLKNQIEEIRVMAGEYLAPDLGVRIGFNALDGD